MRWWVGGVGGEGQEVTTGDAAGQNLTLELIAASIRSEVAHQEHSCWLKKGPTGPQAQISAVGG